MSITLDPTKKAEIDRRINPTPAQLSERFQQELLNSELMRLFAKALARDLSWLATRLANGQPIPAVTEQQIMDRWKQYIADGQVD